MSDINQVEEELAMHMSEKEISKLWIEGGGREQIISEILNNAKRTIEKEVGGIELIDVQAKKSEL